MRKVHENNLNIAGKEVFELEYERVYSDEKRAARINRFFSDKKMIRTFPNLKVTDEDGNIIYFADLVGDITPYYYKFDESLRGDLVVILKKEENKYKELLEKVE